jgi:hypothetical protein
MGETGRMYGGEGKCIQNFGEKSEAKIPLERHT